MPAWPEKAALRIQTPEGVAFALPLAGPTARFFAFAIDMVVVIAISAFSFFILGLASIILGQITFGIAIITMFAVNSLYGIVLEFLWNGQTLGKRVVNIRVADIHGLRLSISQVIVRNLLRGADMLPSFYLVGGIVALLSPYMQRLGDIAANTVVLSTREPQRPAIDQLEPVRYNSLREIPWIEARLRQRTTPEEAALLVRSLLRRNTLEPAARVSYFAELAAHFREKTKLPEAATEGIPDEQFIRNLVDTLFRDAKSR